MDINCSIYDIYEIIAKGVSVEELYTFGVFSLEWKVDCLASGVLSQLLSGVRKTMFTLLTLQSFSTQYPMSHAFFWHSLAL